MHQTFRSFMPVNLFFTDQSKNEWWNVLVSVDVLSTMSFILTIWQRKIPPHTWSNTQNTTKKDYILNYICSFFSGEKGIPNCTENMDTLTSSMNMEFACIITLRVFVYYVCWHDSLGFVINYCPTSDWAMPCPSIRWWISQ